MLLALSTIAALTVVPAAGLEVSCTKKCGLMHEGERSDGWFHSQGCLSQSGVGVKCGFLDVDVMATFLIGKSASLTEANDAKIETGNYSIVNIDQNCQVTMGEEAYISPATGAGRLEFYCGKRAQVQIGVQSIIYMERQSYVNATADLTIGDDLLIQMSQGSTMYVEEGLTFKDGVTVTFLHNARVHFYPSGSASTLTGSQTSLTLQDSASLLVTGTFLVGSGSGSTAMTIRRSGSLIITRNGFYSASSSTFDIGEASYWSIDGGRFTLDSSSSFDSGVQSNLTVTGRLETSGGHLAIAGFSALIVAGDCTNSGSLRTNRFSRIEFGSQSQIQLQSGGNLIAGEWGTIMLQGHLSLADSAQVNIGSNAAISQTDSSAKLSLDSGHITTSKGSAFTQTGGQVSVSSSSSITLAKEAELSAGGSLQLSDNSQLSLSESAEFTASSGEVQLEGRSHFQIGDGASVVLSGSLHMSNAQLSMGQGSSLTSTGGEVQLQESASLQLGLGASVTLSGSMTMTGSQITLGVGSRLVTLGNVNLPQQSSIQLADRATLVLGETFSFLGGQISLNNGAEAYLNGSVIASGQFTMRVNSQGLVKIMPGAAIKPGPETFIAVGTRSDLVLQRPASLSLQSSGSLQVGERNGHSTMVFSGNPRSCLITSQAVIQDYKAVTMRPNVRVNGLSCFG